MINIIRIFVVFIIFECLIQSPKSIINGNSISILVEAKQFNQQDVQQADVYVAELSSDIKTRLNQILNKNFSYTRKPIDLISNDEKTFNHHKRKFVPVLDSSYKEKLEKIMNGERFNIYDDFNLETDSTNSQNEVYTPYINKNGENHGSSSSPLSMKYYGNAKNIKHITSSGVQTKTSNSNFYHSINVNESELTSNKNDTDARKTTIKPFDFTIECMDSEDECYYINNRLENAANYIANVFNIYETIEVEVHILPFCEHMGGENCGKITALTYDPSFVTLNITGQGIYSYPQALVKQFEINKRIRNYGSYDISLYFNTDYLKEHNNGNYILVAAHELIHGMGFFHLMTTASAAFKMEFTEDRIIPQPIVHSYRTSHGNEKAFHGWVPFTVFDRYIVEVEHPDYYIHRGIQEFLEDVGVHKFLSQGDIENYFNNIDISPPTQMYSKSLVHSFCKREAIGFRAYDGEIIPLQTFEKYEPMSSISHIHSPFSCSTSMNCNIPEEKFKDIDDNYLMYYTIISRPVNELVKRFSCQSSYGFIGEKIIKVLKTIGWTEKQDLNNLKQYQNLILSREAKVYSEAYSIFTSSCYILIISILCLLIII